ncbi:MAG: hypothetical protein R3217_06940 [Gammaproteobacteria bacterium]|nr:hypothetical protein [Gammaproteobacteria bacterium]
MRKWHATWLVAGLVAGIIIGRWSVTSAPEVSPAFETGVVDERVANGPGPDVGPLSRQLASVDANRLAVEDRQELASELREVVALLPDSLRLEHVERITGIDPGVVNASGDPDAYLERLLDVALADTVEPSLDESPIHSPVWFSTAGNRDNPMSVFSTRDTVVFANLDSTGSDDALVKWLQVDTGEPVLFKKVALRANERTRVWVRDFEGFSPGTYKVEFYSVESLELLSSGSYQVR